MMATPADLEDFARGLVFTEGLVRRAADVLGVAARPELDHIAVDVQVAATARPPRERGLEGRSGCGVCGSRRIEDVLRPPPAVQGGPRVTAAALACALDGLRRRQTLNAATGATHAAAWCDPAGTVGLLREDVGRHNALDKLVGAMQAQALDPAQGFAVVTSRASYEMVQKAAAAGIGLLAAVSAPTALAIALADSAGLTLIGFARAQDCALYTHPHRYLGPQDAAP
jgi:FdhD protein